jgi:D-alanyl-D-alanine dipeptidase
VEALVLVGMMSLLASPLVDASDVIPGLRVDLRYATSHNLVGRAVSRETRCLLLPEAARALKRAQTLVSRQGFTLLAWDCYRPPEVQQLLWAKEPTPGLVANPRRGSNHSRGVAIDLTLARADGTPVEMPTDFDDVSPRAACNATRGVSAEARTNRATLKRAMLASGFTSIRREWWHFDLKGALGFPVLAGKDAPGTP